MAGPMSDPYGAAVIVGGAQSRYEKNSKRDSKWHLLDAIATALDGAGIAPGEVDGLAVSSFLLAPDNVSTVAQDLGFETRWGFQGAYGGASGVISVLEAARAIRDGLATVVVCAAGDAFTVSSHNEMVGAFTSSIRDYIAPHGFGGANGLFALVQRRHAEQYGTRPEQLARLSVAQRGHALLNDNAIFDVPLTVEDYLTARMIADPLRLYDCVLPCSGGDAVIVTSAGWAAERSVEKPVRILAGGQRHNHDHRDLLPTTQGWAAFAAAMYAECGLAPSDMDFVQLYDDYPIMELIQLEDLGFCEKGGGAFLERTDLTTHGELPVNTGGGQLSAGQAGASGGMIGVTEAVTQLRGDGGERQVPGAELGLVSGFGMVGFGRGLSCSAMILGTV